MKSPFLWQTKGLGSSTHRLVILNTNQIFFGTERNMKMLGLWEWPVFCAFQTFSVKPAHQKTNTASVHDPRPLVSSTFQRETESLDPAPGSLSPFLHPSCNYYSVTGLPTTFKYTEINNQMLKLEEGKESTSCRWRRAAIQTAPGVFPRLSPQTKDSQLQHFSK